MVFKELLGHSNIQTTSRYVGVVEEEKRRPDEALDFKEKAQTEV